MVFFAPREHDTTAFVGESEMLALPVAHLGLIGGFEKDSADPQNFAFLARHSRSFFRGRWICGVAAWLLRSAEWEQQKRQS